jgi:ATP-dependent RNA helicase DDX41
MEPSHKRRRLVQRSPSPQYKLDDEENDDYEPYVPVAQRRQEKLAKLSSWAKTSDKHRPTYAPEDRSDQPQDEDEEETRREKLRKDRTLLAEAQEVHLKKAAEGACSPCFPVTPVYRIPDATKTEAEKRDEEDAELLAAIATRRKLASDLELAKGIQYTETLETS